MTLDARIERLWRSHDDFEFSEAQPTLCAFAQKFYEWTEGLLANATQDPDIVSVNQAKVLLVDKYFEWRSFVPKAHRNNISNRNGHFCIFWVFLNAYERLKVVELSLTPPMLFLPPPPPPPPSPPQIAGIFMGELEKE